MLQSVGPWIGRQGRESRLESVGLAAPGEGSMLEQGRQVCLIVPSVQMISSQLMAATAAGHSTLRHT